MEQKSFSKNVYSRINFSLILLLVLTFVFSQDLFVDISEETQAPSPHNPTVIINTKFKVPTSSRNSVYTSE